MKIAPERHDTSEQTDLRKRLRLFYPTRQRPIIFQAIRWTSRLQFFTSGSRLAYSTCWLQVGCMRPPWSMTCSSLIFTSYLYNVASQLVSLLIILPLDHGVASDRLSYAEHRASISSTPYSTLGIYTTDSLTSPPAPSMSTRTIIALS